MAELDLVLSVLDHMIDGVIILDDQDSIVFINPSARDIFDLEDSKNIINKKIDSVIHDQDFMNMISTRQHGPEYMQEISLDGKKVFITKCASIPGGGTVITLQDITFLKQSERERTEFISTISHDLRSPLTAITGYVDLLERVGPVNQKQKDFIHRVQNSVTTAANLINDLLEFGEINSGISSPSDVVHLGKVLEEAIEAIDLLIKDKEINFVCNIPADIPLIKGNPIKIRQMVDNLLGNALKFTPRHGEVKVSILAESSQLVFQVSDNGPGIPESDQPHIFKRFYRAGNTSAKVAGLGLGLNIVKTIVDMHRGRIWLESSPGNGTTFTVVLPIINNL